jgi:hypothetical protein
MKKSQENKLYRRMNKNYNRQNKIWRKEEIFRLGYHLRFQNPFAHVNAWEKTKWFVEPWYSEDQISQHGWRDVKPKISIQHILRNITHWTIT